jgi:hypothetical protein
VRLLEGRDGDLARAESDARTAFVMDAYLKDAPAILWSAHIATLWQDKLPASWKWCEQGVRDYPRDTRFVDCRLVLAAIDPARKPDPASAWRLVQLANSITSQARAEAEGSSYMPHYRGMLAAAVSARAGDRARARGLLARTQASVSAANNAELATDLEYDEAYLRLLLGERKGALALLSNYLSARPRYVKMVKHDPRWKTLRTDKTFSEAVTRAEKKD